MLHYDLWTKKRERERREERVFVQLIVEEKEL